MEPTPDKVIKPECNKVRVEGPAQWFVCARSARHSGKCRFVPVKPVSSHAEGR